MSRRGASLSVLPDDLYIEPEPWSRIGQPPKHNIQAWTVMEDWSDSAPITDAEVDLFEAWSGDLFDPLFGPCRLSERRVTMSLPLRAVMYLRGSTAEALGATLASSVRNAIRFRR
ncbi:MAG: hypothetical protein KGJ62_02525 [Armatimonadetes bacterium]|nr:hypothetical protein [Armatimonadota bacterium]MDE2205304.1 hypothetical protein [Armatimonadota bacterium]